MILFESLFIFTGMNDLLQTPIEFLKGVGPQRAELLRSELGIRVFEDLLFHFPFRYIDRSVFHKVRDILTTEGYVQLRGRITGISESGARQKRLTVKFQDDTGMIELVWFQGARWVKAGLKTGAEFVVFGKARQYGSKWSIPHPEITELEKITVQSGLQGVYSSTEKLNARGLHSRGLEKLCAQLLEQLGGRIPETLPASLIQSEQLLPLKDALREIHQPSGFELVERARYRLKFEELFFLQLEMLMRRQISLQKVKGFIFEDVGEYFTRFYETHLPFPLTGAQKRVIREIRRDFLSGQHMNRLLQGDVGSGKTLVALMTMLIAVGNGFQAALMAPTEILANQHQQTISKLLEPLGLHVALLTGSTRKKEREKIHAALRDGSLHVLIGTHALLENEVVFSNLGLVVIDEQHRFGVAQRARMWKKNVIPPHVLIMTATPIPRTLSMTFYGDLDVSVIDELPPGRKPITTVHKSEANRLRVFGFLKEEIELGRQVYIVYPLINESETLDYNNLMSGFESISRAFPLPDYRVSIVHGKMKPEDKDFEMKRFVNGETQIMVATTVIEVGVNVPNASVMVIESAERFGLSQLHQLRGRVGRGAEKSYCILMTGDKVSRDSKKRITTMVRTNDGFEIAETDLELRGPGDIMGTQQSGLLNLKIADLSRDGEIVTRARECARAVLEKDPGLSTPEYAVVRQELGKRMKQRPNWSKIS